MITKTIAFSPRNPPMIHQEREFLRTRDLPYFALFHEMGTGKSKIVIDTFTWLYLQGQIDGVIIISDKGCYLNWDEEIQKQIMAGVHYRKVAYASAMRKAEFTFMESVMIAKDDCLDILMLNVEGFSSLAACQTTYRFIQSHYCMMVVDESTSIKNIKAERTKNIIKLGHMCDYRRCLSGTPITQSPLDLFAQCEFLSPGLLGHRTFVGFRNTYAQMQTMNLGSRSFQKIVGYRNIDELTRKIQPFSSRILKTECLDLPEEVFETIYVEQTPEQRMLYDKLKTEAMVMFEQGLLTTTSAITTINKLHQVNCGHVKLDDGTTIDVASDRVSMLLDLLEKIGQKTVIWCAFQRDVELIHLELLRHCEKYPVHYYGKTSPEERCNALDLFKNDSKCQWFIGTAATGGKGIDGLQNVCSHEIYYSKDWNLEDYLQSRARLHRKGQRNKVTIYDMVCQGTVDTRITRALRDKEHVGALVLDKFRELLA